MNIFASEYIWGVTRLSMSLIILIISSIGSYVYNCHSVTNFDS